MAKVVGEQPDQMGALKSLLCKAKCSHRFRSQSRGGGADERSDREPAPSDGNAVHSWKRRRSRLS